MLSECLGCPLKSVPGWVGISSLNAVVPPGFLWEHASRWFVRSSAFTACSELCVLEKLTPPWTELCGLCPLLIPGAVCWGHGVTWPHVLTLNPALKETCVSETIYAHSKWWYWWMMMMMKKMMMNDDPHGLRKTKINPLWTIILTCISLALLCGRCIVYVLSTIRALYLQMRLCVKVPSL